MNDLNGYSNHALIHIPHAGKPPSPHTLNLSHEQITRHTDTLNAPHSFFITVRATDPESQWWFCVLIAILCVFVGILRPCVVVVPSSVPLYGHFASVSSRCIVFTERNVNCHFKERLGFGGVGSGRTGSHWSRAQ